MGVIVVVATFIFRSIDTIDQYIKTVGPTVFLDTLSKICLISPKFYPL